MDDVTVLTNDKTPRLNSLLTQIAPVTKALATRDVASVKNCQLAFDLDTVTMSPTERQRFADHEWSMFARTTVLIPKPY
jgi:hypothetical protein